MVPSVAVFLFSPSHHHSLGHQSLCSNLLLWRNNSGGVGLSSAHGSWTFDLASKWLPLTFLQTTYTVLARKTKQNQATPFGYVTLAPNRSTQTGLNLTFPSSLLEQWFAYHIIDLFKIISIWAENYNNVFGLYNLSDSSTLWKHGAYSVLSHLSNNLWFLWRKSGCESRKYFFKTNNMYRYAKSKLVQKVSIVILCKKFLKPSNLSAMLRDLV